jgi:chemotaxis signal transduction protein
MFEELAASGRLLVFRVGRARFAVELRWVCGVAEREPCDGAGARFRGRDLEALDARELGWGGAAPAGEEGGATAEVILNGGGTYVALLVDAVEGIVDGGAIRAWPELMAPLVDAAFRGVAVRPGGELLVVDPAALAEGARRAADGAAGGGQRA